MMTRQKMWLFLIAAGMCAHALLMGRALESFFGIVALGWAWIAWAALRNRLADAEAMALSMTVILFASSIAFLLVSSDTANVVAHLSLALTPAAVGFACVAMLIRHMRRPRLDDPLVNWSTAVAMAAAARIGKRSRAMPGPVAVANDSPRLAPIANDPAAEPGSRVA